MATLQSKRDAKEAKLKQALTQMGEELETSQGAVEELQKKLADLNDTMKERSDI